jgi:hypothetical protein
MGQEQSLFNEKYGGRIEDVVNNKTEDDLRELEHFEKIFKDYQNKLANIMLKRANFLLTLSHNFTNYANNPLDLQHQAVNHYIFRVN